MIKVMEKIFHYALKILVLCVFLSALVTVTVQFIYQNSQASINISAKEQYYFSKPPALFVRKMADNYLWRFYLTNQELRESDLKMSYKFKDDQDFQLITNLSGKGNYHYFDKTISNFFPDEIELWIKLEQSGKTDYYQYKIIIGKGTSYTTVPGHISQVKTYNDNFWSIAVLTHPLSNITFRSFSPFESFSNIRRSYTFWVEPSQDEVSHNFVLQASSYNKILHSFKTLYIAVNEDDLDKDFKTVRLNQDNSITFVQNPKQEKFMILSILDK